MFLGAAGKAWGEMRAATWLWSNMVEGSRACMTFVMLVLWPRIAVERQHTLEYGSRAASVGASRQRPTIRGGQTEESIHYLLT
jgi:hypothetical protein